MSIEDFCNVPVMERMDLALNQKLIFLDDSGDVIPLKEGMGIITGKARK